MLVESGINMGVYVSNIIRSLCNIGTFLSPLISYFHFYMASQASATFLGIYKVLMYIIRVRPSDILKNVETL